MRRVVVVLVISLAGLGWLADAWAQDQSCLYEGRTYQEGATVCQSGLLQTCVNGEWQGEERCDDQGDGDD